MKTPLQGTTLLRHDVLLSSFLGILTTILACHPQKKTAPQDLAALFPDAAKALGPFSISLEKSRATNILSEARIKLQQGAFRQQVTLQLKMMESQEQVTVSFLHPDNAVNELDAVISEENGVASRCQASTAFAPNLANSTNLPRTPSLHDADTLFHLPLPLSVRQASGLEVSGAGENWNLVDGALVWHPSDQEAARIDLSWTRDHVPELRFPLISEEPPQNLRARRIDHYGSEDIAVRWRDGYVWIAEQSHEAGSWLELQYELPGPRSEFILPQMPEFASMKTLNLHPNCANEQFIVEQNHLSWTCPQHEGTLWAASYQYHQSPVAIDFQDWPELAAQAPSHVKAFWDAGENLELDTHGRTHILRHIPEEAARICFRATWHSNLTH